MNFAKEIEEYYSREIKAIESLDKKQISEAMNCLLKAYEKEATIYVFGNGGSSATASHMVCDFNKGTCEKLDKKFHFVCLNDNIPMMMAVANDRSFDDVFLAQLENKIKKGDVVLAISGSGNSANVVKAAKYAKEKGAKIIAMTGYDGGKLAKLADYQLHVDAQDMQITEDIHMSFDHLVMQIFWKFLAKEAGQRAIYKPHK